MARLTDLCPTLGLTCSVFSIGESVEGRNITVMSVTAWTKHETLKYVKFNFSSIRPHLQYNTLLSFTH